MGDNIINLTGQIADGQSLYIQCAIVAAYCEIL